MSLEQITNLIYGVCKDKGINDIKAANKKIKAALGGYLVKIDKYDNQFATEVWYTVYPNDTDDFDQVGWDFWNKQPA